MEKNEEEIQSFSHNIMHNQNTGNEMVRLLVAASIFKYMYICFVHSRIGMCINLCSATQFMATTALIRLPNKMLQIYVIFSLSLSLTLFRSYFIFCISNGNDTEWATKVGKSTTENMSTDTIEPEPQQRKFIFNVIRMTCSSLVSLCMPIFGHSLCFWYL